MRDDLNYCFWAMREHDYLLTVTYYIPGQVLHEHRLRRTLTANYSIAVRDGQLTVSLEEPDVLGWRIIKVEQRRRMHGEQFKQSSQVSRYQHQSAINSPLRMKKGSAIAPRPRGKQMSLHFIFRHIIAADTIRSLRVDPEDIITHLQQSNFKPVISSRLFCKKATPLVGRL